MAPSRRKRSPCRILIAEDDDAFVDALSELLDRDGRFVIAARARDGREAVDLAASCGADVVLMDIELPILDGIEATREINGRRPELPIVAISGWDYEERALEVRHAGAVDFVRKGRLDEDLAEALLGATRQAL